MKRVRWLIGVLLVSVMLGTVVNAWVLPKQNEVPLKPPEKLTERELQIDTPKGSYKLYIYIDYPIQPPPRRYKAYTWIVVNV